MSWHSVRRDAVLVAHTAEYTAIRPFAVGGLYMHVPKCQKMAHRITLEARKEAQFSRDLCLHVTVSDIPTLPASSGVYSVRRLPANSVKAKTPRALLYQYTKTSLEETAVDEAPMMREWR